MCKKHIDRDNESLEIDSIYICTRFSEFSIMHYVLPCEGHGIVRQHVSEWGIP